MRLTTVGLKNLCFIGSKYARILTKQRQIDEQELEQIAIDKADFLSQAVQNYLKCLQVRRLCVSNSGQTTTSFGWL